jgi:hypothetical protein
MSGDRVYTGPRGKVAHLIPASAAGYVSRAACGLWAWSRSNWRGTGNQTEYDRAASLPLCKTCERKVAGG